MLKKRTVGTKGRQFVAAPLATDFCKSDHLQLSISHFWPVNVAKCCQRNSRENGPEHSKKNTTSQRTGQTSQPSLQDEARIEACFFQIGPAGAAQLLPCTGRNLRAIPKVQLLQGRVAQDFQQVCGPIGTGVIDKAPGVIKKGTVGIKGRQFVAAPLATDFCKSDHLQLSISHFWPVNVAKCCQRNSRENGPEHSKKNTTSQRTGQTSQPSLQDEARIEACFFQIGPAGTTQLLPRSGRNSITIRKVQLLQGRVAQDFQQVCGPIGTGVFVKAPGVLKKGLWGYTNFVGRWHIEKGTFMPSKPQSSKNLAFVGGRPYYHLDGAKCNIYAKYNKSSDKH